MLELVKNIEFVKNKKLKVNKISEKQFILENDDEKFILSLFPYGKFSKISKIFECLNDFSNEFSNITYSDIGVLNDKFCYRIIPYIVDKKHKFLAIIPAHNEEAVVENLIESLQDQTYDKKDYDKSTIYWDLVYNLLVEWYRDNRIMFKEWNASIDIEIYILIDDELIKNKDTISL